jgi:hypothetical protein
MLTRMITIGKCVWLAVFPSSSRELNLLLLSEFSSPARVKGLGCLEKLSEEPREHFPELAIATVEDRQDREREKQLSAMWHLEMLCRLLTPPGTPLFPSLDLESHAYTPLQQGLLMNHSLAAIKTSRVCLLMLPSLTRGFGLQSTIDPSLCASFLMKVSFGV